MRLLNPIEAAAWGPFSAALRAIPGTEPERLSCDACRQTVRVGMIFAISSGRNFLAF